MGARLFLLAVAAAATQACVTVEMPTPEARVVPLGVAGRVETDRGSARRVVTFRHGAVGIANTYRVPVGDALRRYAEAFLGAALDEGDELVVRLALEEAELEHFALRTATRVEVVRGGEVLLRETYRVEAPSYFAGVASSERTSAEIALRRTTHDALALTLRELLIDLRAALEGT